MAPGRRRSVLHRVGGPPSRAFSALAAGVSASWVATVGGLPVEVPVKLDATQGLFTARIDMGTPVQRLWAAIDSASPWLWIPKASDDKAPGFQEQDSSHSELGRRDSLKYAEGLSVDGYHLKDTAKLGDATVQNAPLLLAVNVSKGGAPEELSLVENQPVGMLGLTMHDEEVQLGRYQSQNIFEMFGNSDSKEESGEKLGSFFNAFWKEHPEVGKTFFLSLGGPRPRMVIGADLDMGVDAVEFRFLADKFTKQSRLWYTSVRAIGFSLADSSGSGSGTLVWNLDFNQYQWGSLGVPARLDSGSNAIKVTKVVFERFLEELGDGSCVVNSVKGLDCPCDVRKIEASFPWISISFETLDNVRFLGLDAGNDVRACIPPSAYVTPAPQQGYCRLAIVDGGRYQRFFGIEGIVLGVPFFRSVAVGLDVGNRRIAIRQAAHSQSSAAGSAMIAGDSAQVEEAAPSPAVSSDSVGLNMARPPKVCPCADPKNWWQVGHRFSPYRCIVVLIGTAMVLTYVYVGYSPNAEGIRNQLEGISEGIRTRLDSCLGPPAPGGHPVGNAANRQEYDGQRQEGPDRPFVQMTGQQWHGPE